MTRPGHRRRHDQPARRGRRRRRRAARPAPPTVPAGDAVPRPRRVRRRRARRRVLDAARTSARRRTASRSTASASPTSGRRTIVWDRSHGRADRPGPRLAGPAHRRRVHHRQGRARPAPRPEPVGDEGRLAARHVRRRPRPRPVLRHGRHVGRLGAVRGRGARHRPRRTPRSPACSWPTPPAWSTAACAALGVPMAMLPDARRLDRRRSARPPRSPARRRSRPRRRPAGQPRRPGLRHARAAKITFGTGGMLDVCTGPTAPASAQPRRQRHVPDRRLASCRRDARGAPRRSCCRPARTSSGCATTSASSTTAADSHDVAAQCDDTDGVVFVPALLGLGTPHWDYGARGTLLGLTRGSGRPHVVRAVLEGVAHRGADLVEAAEADTASPIDVAPGRRRDEPTTRRSSRRWPTPPAGASRCPAAPRPRRSAPPTSPAWPPGCGARSTRSPMPGGRGRWSSRPAALDREQWADAVEPRPGWIPDLSALDF